MAATKIQSPVAELTATHFAIMSSKMAASRVAFLAACKDRPEAIVGTTVLYDGSTASLLERYDSGVLIYANYWSTAQIIGVIFETLAT